MLTPMDDKSLMPFGRYKGIPLEGVPAGYLLWWADQSWTAQWPELLAYVDKHRDLLETENGDRD